MHILECTSVGAKLAWDASVGKLKEWFDSSNSCPALSDLVLTIVGNFKNKDKITPNDYYSFEGVEKVFQKQKDIGWRLVIGGCLTHEWAKVQQNLL